MSGEVVINQGVQKLNLAIVTNGHKTEVLKQGSINTLKVKQGDKFKIIQNINDEEVLADNVIAIRSGDTLQLSYADSTSLHVENFYAAKEVAIELPSSTPNAVFQLHSSSGLSFQALSDGTNFIYSSGDKAVLSQMATYDHSLQLALHEHMDFVNAPRFVDAGNIATDALPAGGNATAVGAGAAAGASLGATQILLGALAIGGVAAAAGGGGGGGGSAAPAADTTAPVLTGALTHSVSQTVVLTYDSPLDATHLPATTDFAITTGGAANLVASVAISGNTITLTLTNAFLATDAIVINYTDPTAGNDINAIQDIFGNDAISLVALGSGVVADGYVRGAQLWIDTNSDGKADYNTGVKTDESGNFFLPPSTPAGSIIAIGGVNIDTGVPNTMPLSAPAGSTVINPLTTLVQAIVASTGVSASDASDSVVAALGLTPGTNLKTFDPLDAAGGANALAAQKAAATIATISIMADENSAASDVQTTIMNNLVTQITQASQAGETVNLGDSGVVGSLLDGVTGLDLAAQSSIADASNAVSTAANLAAISQAQSQYLDTIAPGSSTITVTTPTNDTTPSIKVNLDISSTDGKAVVENDTVSLVIDGVTVTTQAISATDVANGYVTFNAPTLTEGSHTISAKVIDQSGNMGTAYPLQTVVIDTTAPTAPTIGTVATDNVINAAEEAGSVTISGTTEAGSTVTVNSHNATVTGTTWSYTLSAPTIALMGEGAETLTIISTDVAGNTATTTKNITVDTVAPTNTVTIDSITDNVTPTTGAITAGSTTNDNTLEIAGTLSVAFANGEKLAVYDGSVLIGYATVTDTAWTLTTSSLSNAAHSFTAVAIDTAGNAGTPSTAFGLTVNATIPTTTATITQSLTTTNDATPTISGSVSADVAGEKVIIYDGTTKLGEATRTGTTWSFDTSALADGSHSFTAVVENAGGNQGSKSATYALTIDTESPTVLTIAKVANDDVINQAEKTAGVTLTGTTEAGSTVTINGESATVTGTTWSYTFSSSDYSSMGEGPDTLTIISTDAAGNATQITKDISVDTVASSIAINAISTNNAINTTEKLSGVQISGTAEADSTVILELGAGNTKSVLTNSGGVWLYDISDADYKVLGTSATIKATAVDSAGNSAFATQAITIDTIAPALSPITLATASDTGVIGDRKGNDTTPDFTFTAESGATIAYSLDGTSYTSLASGTGSAQTLSTPELTDGNKDYTIYLKATDSAGNETIRTATYTLDTTAPTATITMNDTALKTGETATVTITFSEAVSGFALGDLSAQNGTLSNLVQNATNPKVYTATFTPTTNIEDTSNVISLATTYTDIAGNVGTTTDSANYAVDTKAPTATITMDDVALKSGDTSTVTIVFSEAVAAFVVEDLSAQNGILSGLATSDNITWTATFTPTANIEDTTNVISLATTYTDTAGNAGTVATSANYVLDTIAPTATITMNDVALKVGETAIVTITFSELVSDFVLSDLSAQNGTLSNLVQNATNPKVYTATFTPTADIEDATNVISLATTYTDIAGNTGTIATSANYAVDSTAPTATITLADSALKIGETSVVTIVFSEAVASFANADLTVASGTLSAVTSSDNITWTATFTPTANIEDATNVISLATTYTDVVGNVGTVASSANYMIDTAAPTVTISAVSGGYVNNAEDENAVTISGVTTGVEDGQTVTVTLNSTDYTATVASNAWTLDVPSTDIKALSEGTITLTADVSDLAGNDATQASKTFEYDITAPTISSGATASVSENIATAVYTATATGINTYSLSGTDAGLFNINATTGEVTLKVSPDFENPTDVGTNNIYDIQVIATDAAGNASIAKDVAITVNNVDVTVNDVATDNIINATEKTAGVVLSGTNEPSAAVTVNGNAATVTGTTWSYTLNSAAIAAMGEGLETLTIVSGGQTVTKDITIDTLAPTVTIDTIATDGIINADEKAVLGTISGTTTAENGQVVTVKVGGTTLGTATANSGSWSLTGIDLTVLADASYTITADVKDLAGNNATQATKTFTVDTIAATPIVSLLTDAGPSATDKITNVSTVSVSNVENGATVEYSLVKGTWVTDQATLSFEEGENTLHVRQTDAAGNISAESEFTFMYDTTAPTKANGLSAYIISEDNAITVSSNVVGADGAKLVDSSGTKIGASALFANGTATIDVSAQTSVTTARIVAYDQAGNFIKPTAEIYLGTSGNDTLTSNTTYGDAMFGFGGTDTFVLKAGASIATIADYASTEKIDCGTGETLWSSGSAPTDWEIDANGMATYTGSMNGITDLADKFFTDFSTTTGTAGAVVGLVANGKTYIFGEGATNADTDNYKVRIVETDTTTGLSISSGTVQLLGVPTPVAFNITSLLSSGVTFFEAYPEYLESTTIVLQGTSGTYKDYIYDGSVFNIDGSGGTISIVNNSGVLTVTHDGTTQTVSFSNAHTVSSIQGITTTGLNQVTATFTTLSVPTVATATDWWVSNYIYGSNGAPEPFTTLESFKDLLIQQDNLYSVWISDDLTVKLQSDGTLKSFVDHKDGTGTVGSAVAGSWSLTNGYLTITATDEGTSAFKMDGSTMMQTEIAAVGSVSTETWYYGPTETQFLSVLDDIFNAYTPHVNTAPALTLYDGETLGLVVAENSTDPVQTFTAMDMDNDTLTYSLSGLDASAFNISSTGVLTFKVAPNYETSTDTNHDNVYDVAVAVSDGNGGTATQSVHIHVKDVNEGTTINGFSATTLITNGQANFFTLYEGGKEFEHINLNNAAAGSWNDYLYTTPYFAPKESGSFTYVDNHDNTLTITDAGEGGKVSTLVLSNAQTAVTSGGVDIHTWGFNQVTATFTVTTASALESTTDWWASGYTGFTTLAGLKNYLVGSTDGQQYVWINDNLAVELVGTTGMTSGSLIELVWNGSTDAGGNKVLVEGALVENGSWTLGNDYLTVNVAGVGEAVFKVDNSTIMKTEIEAVGSTHSETFYYHDTMSAIDFADALGTHNSNITGYQGVVTEDNAHNYDLSFLDTAAINLALGSLSTSFDRKLSTINMVDDGNLVDTILSVTAADVLRLSVNGTITIQNDSADDAILDLASSGWTMGTPDDHGTYYDTTYTQAAATIIVHTVVL